jgi:hypothetical protein
MDPLLSPLLSPPTRPQNLSHQMALSLEKRAGPCQPFDQARRRDDTDDDDGDRSALVA